MGRRAKPKQGKAEPIARTSPKNDAPRVRDLETRLAEALTREGEALERETATSEVLRVISQSPTDAQPVFDTIAASASRLCGGVAAIVTRFDGEMMYLVAHHNPRPGIVPATARYPRRPSRDTATGRAMLECGIVYIPDAEKDPDLAPNLAREVRAGGFLAVPMLRDGRPIGAITVSSAETGAFPGGQIELLKTFADQAVIAIENVRLFTELQARNAEVTEALERQVATGAILRAISESPTDSQPVFETIMRNGVRVCEASSCLVFVVVDDQLHLVATDVDQPHLAQLRSLYPAKIDAELPTAQAIRERRVVHVPDVEHNPEASPAMRRICHAGGYRTVLFVPMLRGDLAVGAVSVGRTDATPFSDRQIELLQTFADQAVIAIENVRLFNETKEALEQQTATSEILRVIAGSPTDAQPVFDAILKRAATLCEAQLAHLWLYEGGEEFRLGAGYGSRPDHLQWLQQGLHRFGQPFFRESGPWRIGQVLDVRDTEPYRRGEPLWIRTADHEGMRTLLGVPLVKDERLVGSIAVYRREVQPFTDQQTALVQTFADQAVIAIENVRLFKELQEKNGALTQAHAQVSEALEQQTATSEILRVISRSQADARPVFEAIAQNAMRLFRAWAVQVYRLDGHWLHLEAARGGRGDMGLPDWAVEHEVSRASYRGQSILDRAIVHVRDVLSDPSASDRAREWARADGWRSAINAPMLLDSAPIGLITVYRLEPGGFLSTEVQLLQTFADQAVIAVGNARLLVELHARTDELQRSVEQLTALGEVGRAVSSTLDLETVLTTIVSRAVELSGLDGGVVFEYDEGTEEFAQRAATEQGGELAAARRTRRIRRGEGVVGQTAVTLEPAQVPDILPEGAYASPLRENLLQSGIRAVLAVPMLWETRLIGSLVVSRNTPGDFPPGTVDLFRTFATQSALAIQNARLFREIEVKSRELEAASQHKSEFLANMSHELRTPLNAIIGYSELLEEEAGDLDGGRLVPDLQKIATAAKHQLSLINDILDLSKIEAGRMELELAEFDLPTAIENALILVRERASRRGIRLGSTIDERLGVIGGDERKVKQVLLNLLSNALKFTPEGGRIDVRAEVQDEVAEVSVTDTGVGIAPEDQEAVFEEFRQVGTADKKVEGTGLGLALSRKFIELHGGRIWVQSQIGHGSTFTFTLPVRHEG